MNAPAEQLRVRFYNSDPGWVNGTERFARIVRRCLRPEMRILNLGAGPGRSSLHFDTLVRTVVGIDPDEAIKAHPRLSIKLRGVAQALPFRDRSFDLIYLDWVVEHLPAPDCMAAEAIRVLTPGGHLLFRTGNLFHYSYGVAALTPHTFHEKVVGALGGSETHAYPSFYRMNTAGKVRRTMKRVGFIEEQLLMMEPDPAYVGMNRATFLAGVAYERIVNRLSVLQGLRANILGCYRKP